jgi:hypothetical protein
MPNPGRLQAGPREDHRWLQELTSFDSIERVVLVAFDDRIERELLLAIRPKRRSACWNRGFQTR